jgi:hypothetical protein
MTEDQLEQETLGWLTDTGYLHRYGLDIAPKQKKGSGLQNTETEFCRLSRVFSGVIA